ncbi:MAG: hypothetical protein MUE44_07230 [Oscillatoriaceae cyanobacterium Prado104]|nr:hypothetical protein [Oscillatoriaceae cyanobacterium Prado104]
MFAPNRARTGFNECRRLGKSSGFRENECDAIICDRALTVFLAVRSRPIDYPQSGTRSKYCARSEVILVSLVKFKKFRT